MRTEGFFAVIGWGPRLETPSQLAARLISTIEGVRTFDPLFSQWYTVSYEEVFEPLEVHGRSLADRLALRVRKDDDGKPDIRAGYPMTVYNFALFKKALIVLMDAFDASSGFVSSSTLADLNSKDREPPRLGLKWMTYLGPRFAHFAIPPPSAIVERRPNGGIFMAATDEVFSAENTEHMAVARDIQASIAAFNALKRSYPGLELPEA